MSKIIPLSAKSENEIKELLKTADKSLSTQESVLIKGSAAATLVGTLVGGSFGTALLTGGISSIPLAVSGSVAGSALGGAAVGGALAGGAAIAGTAFGTGAATIGASYLIGGSITAGAVFPPIAIIAGLVAAVAAVGAIIGGEKKKQEIEEKRKQANYCNELCEKMNCLYEKHKEEMERKDAIIAEDEEIIRKQQEKIAEYELLFEAMKKKYDSMAVNFA